MDAHKNLAYSTIATAPSPAASGTSIVVAAGQGTRFPSVPFNATIWPISDIPLPTNAEIVRVTGISTDTLTITRAQEGTSARSVIVGDQIAATITALILTDIEGAVNVVSQAVSVVSNALSVETAARVAKDDTLSNQISVLSQGVSVLSQSVSVLSQAVSVLSQGHSVLSQQVSVLSGQVSTVSVAVTSVDTRLNTVSQQVSVLSQQVSVLSQNVSVISNALSNEISNRISADNILSNGISVVSNALSNEISNRVSAVNALSNSISVVSNALSNEISNRVSAINAISQQISVISQALSVDKAALSVRIDVVSQLVSAQLSVLSQQISVLSQQVSVLSQGVSVVSNALSNEISNRVSADNALSVHIDTISQQVSVLSQAMSVLSAGLGTAQMKVVGNLQGVSATAGAKISGLSISVAASGVYAVEANILYSTSGTISAVGFGMSLSGATFAAVGGMWEMLVSVINNTAASTAIVRGTFNAVVSAQVSAAGPGTGGIVSFARMDGLITLSTTGGTIRLRARVGGGAMNLLKGSFFRAYKIG